MSEYLTQADYVRLKSRLTRAINTKNPTKVLAEVQYFREFCAGKVYPDSWSRWQRAADDAYYQAQRQGIAAQRVELD